MTSPDDRWDLLGPYTPSRLESASPPFIGRRFGTNVNPRLCEGQSFCDFGDHSAPRLLDAYVGDMDGSGSWSVLDQLVLTFDRPTNRLGHEEGALNAARLFEIFEFRASFFSQSISETADEWTLGSRLRAHWTDARTLVIEPLELNATILSELMPDATQCGRRDANNILITCPHQRAMGGTTGAGDTYNIPQGQGFRLRVSVKQSAGLKAASNSPLALAASGSPWGDFAMQHCYAGPMVRSASIRDPDNADGVYSAGDEVVVRFTLDTARPTVLTKWDIDKYLTFCTPCNPGCERARVREGIPIDAEYNGLGAEYSGYWEDPQTLVITIINATLPMPWLCDSNLLGSRAEPPNFRSGSWFVTTSFSASQAPMLVCYGGVTVPQCAYGEPSPQSVPRATDQFGNGGLDNYGRMLGPRYPHSWSRRDARQCEDYLTFFNNYATTPPVIRRWPITGNVGPAGTPTIIEFSASDPHDLNLTYGAGDELRITFDMATDRSNSTMLGRYSGEREYVDSLFAFNAQLGQSYSGEWLDDSIFQITILEPTYRSLPPFLADGHVHPNNTCTVRPRDALVIRNLAGTSEPLTETSAALTGDCGLDEPPVLASVVGEDPDFGDATVAFGDVLRLTFDRATDLGCQSAIPPAVAAPWGVCPYDIGKRVPAAVVSTWFNFSVALGDAYEGEWTDDSTFVISIVDGTGSQLNSELGAILVKTQGRVRNQGCRLNTARKCNGASSFVGPIVASEVDRSSPFRAEFGVTPSIVLVSVDDPDHGDSAFGAGDQISIVFDQATDRGRGAVAGNSAYVDSLFSVSMPVGLNYQGQWKDDSTFVIEAISVPAAMTATVASTEKVMLTLNKVIRDRTSRSRASAGMAPASLDELKLRSHFPLFESTIPYIVNVTVEDYDNGDAVYGAGDLITVRFNHGTNLGANEGGKAFVDQLFHFDPPIGADYTGEWADARTFRVRALDTLGGELRICNHAGCEPRLRSNVTLVGTLRNRGGTSPGAVTSSALGGISDSGAPQLERFEVRDPGAATNNDVDYVFSDGDQITIAFDRSTDLGAVEAKQKRVEALFDFSIAPGVDYTGAWMDDSVFTITVMDTRYELPLINQTVVTVLKPIRSIYDAGGGRLNVTEPLNQTNVVLQGHFGRARRPRLAGFVSRRARQFFGAVPGPVYYTLHFDEPTNRTCSFCGANGTTAAEWTREAATASVDELFGFSVQLGGSYWGEWRNSSTFELTILEQFVNTSAGLTPTVGVTVANLTGMAVLYNERGNLPASTNELVTLEGDPAELMAPETDVPPLPKLPHVSTFQLLHAGHGGLRPDGSFGANATLLLEFNTSAHVPGEVWHHYFVNENSSAAFWGGSWTAAGSEDRIGTFHAQEGLLFGAALGARYRGEWLSRTRLLISVLELEHAHASSRARVGVTTVRTRIGGVETANATLRTTLSSRSAPRLLSALANDPDNLDYVYSTGDTVSLYFSRPTDRAGGPKSGDKAFVDGLVSFSQPLAYDYSGEWTSSSADGLLDADSVFRITILEATCPGCTPMPDPVNGATVKPKNAAAIRTRSSSSPRAFAPSPPLAGDYGKTRGPMIVSFAADDFDNGDAVYGGGDTLTVTFDLATDRGGRSARFTMDSSDPCSLPVDTWAPVASQPPPGARLCPYDMLNFSAPLGADVRAAWSDDSTLVMTIVEPSGHGDVLVGLATVRPRSIVRNRGCCADYTLEGCAIGSACCCYDSMNSVVALLVGDFGNELPPAVSSFIGTDPDDGDATYGASDVLTVTFDMATDRGQGDPEGGKQWVDDLLWFSLPIGDDYSGEWIEEDSAMRISILKPASSLSSLPEAHFACVQLSGTAAPPNCYDNVRPVSMLNVSEAYWRRTLVQARGDGVDLDTDGNTGDLRNRARTSAAADAVPRVQGQLGTLSAPNIVSFRIEDPQNGDEVFGPGDVITIVLDRPVDQATIGPTGGRDAVDRTFGFTTPLGAAYAGSWNDTSTFIIEIEDSTGAGIVELGATRVFPSVRSNAVRLRNSAGCPASVAEASCLMPFTPPPMRLVGDFGQLPEAPVFVEVIAEDYDNLDAIYSANDTISLKFDRPTNKGGGETSGGTEYVDSLLNFSTPLGNAYSGRWNEEGTAFDITIDDAGNGSVVLLSQIMYDENNTVVVPPTYVTLVADVRTALGNSRPITANRSLPLSGNVGENSTDAFPRVKSVFGRERRKNLEWEIVLGLDRASDRGATRLPSHCDHTGILSYPCVLGSPYSLFSVTPDDAFSGPLKTATGSWRDASTFVISTDLDVTGFGRSELNPLRFGGGGGSEFLQFGTTQMLYTHGLLTNGTQVCAETNVRTDLTCPPLQVVPMPPSPALVSFTVSDADNRDAVHAR